jgi:S-adenosylmethionine:tRNA ribosyltransferase-isomerase
MPLPPYIAGRRAADERDRADYQTLYAREEGAVAAPTAGLHFTDELLRDVARHGVRRADVVLHVGAGTFKPVEVDDPARHVMHEEWYMIPESTAALVSSAKHGEGAVWTVGTTSVRTLESAAREDGTVVAGAGETRIFIRPPYRFRTVDRLVTNFHLPRSTLIMLVAAFAGYDLTMRAYRQAIAAGYRFYSYGDAMAIL